MKKYLFGLGAMLVGAGLMFVFTHTEVSAESETERCEQLVIPYNKHENTTSMYYCEVRELTCVLSGMGVSCVKKGGLFK